MRRLPIATAAAALIALVAALSPAAGSPRLHAARFQTTLLISRARGGGIPNGPSTHPVISGDRRYARVIAFESDASDLVRSDTNGQRDVFFVRRSGHFGNDGSLWHGGDARLISRGLGGGGANGPSFAVGVGGNYRHAPRCAVFLSAASNLVRGDTNGVVDAFVSSGPGGRVKRVSLPGGHQAAQPTTDVATAGDCSRFTFVTGGQLYTRTGGHTYHLKTRANPANPSYDIGESDDLVFDASGDIYLSSWGTHRPKRIVKDGRNPAYNSKRRRVVAYEAHRHGHWQIAFRDLGRGEHIVSSYGDRLGNHDSHDPVVANSGYYIAFESEATNLGTTAARERKDENGRPDGYLYTDVRDLTLAQSVEDYGHPLPGGGSNPDVSYYANYFVFDSPAPLGSEAGEHQVFMRYLGGR